MNFPGDQSSVHDVWMGLTGDKTIDMHATCTHVYCLIEDAIPSFVKTLVGFAREVSRKANQRSLYLLFYSINIQMPAINELESNDFHRLINNRLFDLWLVRSVRICFVVLRIIHVRCFLIVCQT
jgi:hypothetical protein